MKSALIVKFGDFYTSVVIPRKMALMLTFIAQMMPKQEYLLGNQPSSTVAQ